MSMEVLVVATREHMELSDIMVKEATEVNMEVIMVLLVIMAAVITVDTGGLMDTSILHAILHVIPHHAVEVVVAVDTVGTVRLMESMFTRNIR